jgi:hypothetical protein
MGKKPSAPPKVVTEPLDDGREAPKPEHPSTSVTPDAASRTEVKSLIPGQTADPMDVGERGTLRIPQARRLKDSRVATWDVGRMLSQLNWDLQMGLLKAHGPWEQLDRMVEGIALTARDIVETTLAKDRIEGAIRIEWCSFLQKRADAAEQGYPHIFLLFDANLTLISRKYEAWDFREIHDDVCEHLVTPAVDFVGRLVAILEGVIGEDEIRALHLGKLVDHGVHPQDAFRLTFQVPVDFDNPTVDYEDPRKGSWWLATREPLPGETIPQCSWFRQVQKRWDELGILKSLPPLFGRIEDGEIGVEAIKDLAELIKEINQAALEGMTGLCHTVSPGISQQTSGEGEQTANELTAPRPGYLGLLLHKDRLMLERQSREGSVEFAKKKLLWGLLLKLEKYGETWCPREIIRDVWKDYGRTDVPQRGTVDDALNELEALLEPKLRVTIENARDVGWRLIDMDSGLHQ